MLDDLATRRHKNANRHNPSSLRTRSPTQTASTSTAPRRSAASRRSRWHTGRWTWATRRRTWSGRGSVSAWSHRQPAPSARSPCSAGSWSLSSIAAHTAACLSASEQSNTSLLTLVQRELITSLLKWHRNYYYHRFVATEQANTCWLVTSQSRTEDFVLTWNK